MFQYMLLVVEEGGKKMLFFVQYSVIVNFPESLSGGYRGHEHTYYYLFCCRTASGCFAFRVINITVPLFHE